MSKRVYTDSSSYGQRQIVLDFVPDMAIEDAVLMRSLSTDAETQTYGLDTSNIDFTSALLKKQLQLMTTLNRVDLFSNSNMDVNTLLQGSIDTQDGQAMSIWGS